MTHIIETIFFNFSGGRIIVSNKAGKPVTKLKKIAERLHPNPKVTVYEKDPTFEMKYVVYFLGN